MGSIDWIDVAQDRDRWRAVNAVMKLRVLEHAGNIWTALELVSLWKRTLVHGVSK